LSQKKRCIKEFKDFLEIKREEKLLEMMAICKQKIETDFYLDSVSSLNEILFKGLKYIMHIVARLHNLVFQRTPEGINYYFIHIHNYGAINRCIAKLDL
jgi:hypothetical protein